ncbi:MAG: zinc carboxypeptidase [Gemmatimonadetes bacterium]|nr:M14 family zinc carboxypeptidase [Gemmatimonadota bacterium]MYA43290.1 zinc carboxypeptidase [Gemmatimonadota bacterium]MYE93592.1 zinc carboxypeptidase [Gemmatimonadota bacterium]MYJ11899.1 zinc carboxypeptidase [Gemmatimonadota bacterium]
MLSTLALAAVIQMPAQVPELVPGTRYDPDIPTLEEVVGHDFGEVITPPADVIRYMEALAAAAPERTHLIRYAESWEGRPLVVLVIGSAERMARLDDVKADLARLADPRELSDNEAEALLAQLPVVTALMHSIHGNEISPSGAAMAEAYHLLAATGSADVDLILSESLVLIDPLENPDGRNRFVYQNQIAQARWPDEATVSAEHDEPWPGGRSNHYLFDLNRDLFIQSQPETRGKVDVLLDFKPQIVADLHEMGGDATYFFPPTAPPSNPWYGERQIALMDVFGSATAARFDERGFAYFNREVFDLFYPGYVDMWPMGYGGLGMTYEQASARALRLRQSDGDLLTYGDGVLHHFTAAIETALTAARNRERILRDYLAFRRDGVAAGQSGPAEIVLHSAHDPGMAERLAMMMVENGVEVYRASGPVTAGDRTLSAGSSFIVPLDQPMHGFIHNLLDPHVPMAEDFVQRQIERRANRQPDEIYDLTAWSQSLLWDVEAIQADATGARGDAVTAEDAATRPEVLGDDAGGGPVVALPEAVVGYLIPWGTNAAAAVVEALREGIRVRAAGAEFTLGGRRYGTGTAIVRVAENGPDLRTSLARIAARHSAEVVPIDDAYVREGMSLGSGRVRGLREPRVLLVYDAPGQSYSVGWTRYILERRYGQRTTTVRASSLGRATLADYDVIVFPSGNYGSAVGGGLVDRLQAWMRDGGTVITMAESSRWASRAGLLATETERRGGRAEGDDPPDPGTPDQPIEYLDAISPDDESPEGVPGAILRTVLDTEHWLSAGTDGEIGVLVEGSRVFRPITLDDGTNVGRYADLENLVLGGIVWEESRPQLANKAFLIHQPVGRGQLVAFAEDPNYRAYAEATQLLFMNAVLLGPGR